MTDKKPQLQGENKKRTYDDHLTLTQISAMQLGHAFRSKADFHDYWSQCAKVRALIDLTLLSIVYSYMYRRRATSRRSGSG